MIAVSPSLIPAIDAYAATSMGIPTLTLMRRAGDFIAKAIRERIPVGSPVLLYCGSGNNGGDGYAAAVRLLRDGYQARAVDLLFAGQRTEEGKTCLSDYISLAGPPLTAKEAQDFPAVCLVDAVFGTGGHEPFPEAVTEMAQRFQDPAGALRVAVDIPLGVNAESGRLAPLFAPVDLTLCLSFPKYGLYSYPARSVCGDILTDPLGLPSEPLRRRFCLDETLTDAGTLTPLFPKRKSDTHKGIYGHLLLLCGSGAYRGAAVMSALAAVSLRMGAGLVTLASEESVLAAVLPRVPEVISKSIPPVADLPDNTLLSLTEKKTCVLLGPGSEATEALFEKIRLLLSVAGPPLVLDAGALGALALRRADAEACLMKAKRKVIFTPHPAEFARMLDLSVQEVQENRLEAARSFARKIPGVLILKGAGTIVAEGERFSVNTSGGPALSKGGSGDILAGAVAALICNGLSPYDAARAAVYLHGAAGDSLSRIFSDRGVLPTDLPAEMARTLARLTGEGGAS